MAPDHDRLTPLILESIGEGVFTVDHEFRITSLNQAAEALTGWSWEQVQGMHCHDVFRADICQDQCALRHTVASGKPLRDVRATILDREMNEIPVTLSTAVLRESDGAVVGGVEVIRDISELETLRRALRGEHPTFECGERKQHLRHAVGCAACREKLLGGRPERLFMLLASEAPPADELDRLTAEVMRQVEGAGALRGFRMRVRALVPVAASIVLAGFFGIYTTLNRVQSPLAQRGQAPSVHARDLSPSVAAEGIDLISSPGDAQVMEFTVGETQVVMIFDEALDI